MYDFSLRVTAVLEYIIAKTCLSEFIGQGVWSQPEVWSSCLSNRWLRASLTCASAQLRMWPYPPCHNIALR